MASGKRDRPVEAISGRLTCTFVTVMWGDWHVGMFLDANLPTMLAPGNLPAFTRAIDLEYLIYTTPDDAARMTRSLSFQRLRTLVKVDLKSFTPQSTNDPIALHHSIWEEGIDRARAGGSFIVLMPPDVVWADGSFAHLAAALGEGKHAIFMTYPRVVSETLVPSMLHRFPPDENAAITIPAPEMVSLALTHIHPLMAAYTRSGSHFPVHPEMVIWPVEGDGFLLRLLARELFCFEPGRYDLNQQSLLRSMPRVSEIHLFRDSTEFLGLSLTPLWKDLEWYLQPCRLNPLFIGRWWTSYDSPINDYLSNQNMRFWRGKAPEERWRRVEREADLLITHLKFAREFVCVLMAMLEAGCYRAAELLATALRVHGIARRWPHRGRFLILVPNDGVLDRHVTDRLTAPGISRNDVRSLLEAHLAPISALHDLTQKNSFTTLAGEHVIIEELGNAKRCRDNLLIPISRLLGSQVLGAPKIPPDADSIGSNLRFVDE